LRSKIVQAVERHSRATSLRLDCHARLSPGEAVRGNGAQERTFLIPP
jgi:hypothetical protein